MGSIPIYFQLLPFVEEPAVVALFDPNLGFNDNFAVTNSYISITHCPSDEPVVFFPTGDYKGNYGMNWGQGDWGQNNTRARNAWGQRSLLGPFQRKLENTGTQFRQITDGLSHTMLMMEMIQAPSEDVAEKIDRRGRLWKAYAGTNQLSTQTGPNSTEPDLIHQCVDRPELNLPCDTRIGWWNQRMAARSRHPGGVHIGMCDGSARFETDNIDLKAWQAMSSMAGGETENLQ